jgi:hypothetical protein
MSFDIEDYYGFTLTQWRIIHYSAVLCASASLMGALFVLIAVRRLHDITNIPVTLQFPFWLSFCQVIYSLCEIIDHGLTLSEIRVSPTSCNLLATINVGFHTAATLWALANAYYVYRILATNSLWSCGEREWKPHLFAWGTALLVLIVFIVTGQLGPTPIHCFVLDENILLGYSTLNMSCYLHIVLYLSTFLSFDTYKLSPAPQPSGAPNNQSTNMLANDKFGGAQRFESTEDLKVYTLEEKTSKGAKQRIAYGMSMFTMVWFFQNVIPALLSILLPQPSTVFYILFALTTNIGGMGSWIVFKRIFAVVIKMNKQRVQKRN